MQGFGVPEHTPVPVKVAGVENPVQSLNGEWNFRVKEHGTAGQAIRVPGEWEMQGFTVNEGETAIYSKNLKIPADWKGKPVVLRFDGVSSHARVLVNGKAVAEHEGSFVPFEAEISGSLNFNNDLLEVEVQALTVSDRLASTSQYACHTVGGILRKVTLFTTAPARMTSFWVETLFDARYRSATLIMRTTMANHTGKPVAAKMLYTLLDSGGREVSHTYAPFYIKEMRDPAGVMEIHLEVKSPVQWNPEHPYLYTLVVSQEVNGNTVQVNEQKVGFRQVTVDGNRLLVNGKPVKLHGVNRHSVYPLTGRSISPDLDRKDAELFREANCNYIRTSHYPPSEEFLNAADELGLFVESEASLCWIQHGAAPIWRTWNYLDNRFLPIMVRANMDNIIAGRNHPSVIIWSLGNESLWSPLWETVLAVVKELDRTRPTTFHDQCWGGYNNGGSKADIAVYHYPGLNGPAAADTGRRPVLFGEYAHLSCYNRRELLTDPGVRSAYGPPLVQFYDSIYHYPGCLGGAIWSGVDDIFHMPDGRIVGYGPWGPIDAWRRPKPEYWGMKRAYSPVRVLAADLSGKNMGYITLTVENRYDFTPLDEIRITAESNSMKLAVTGSIPPHGTGTIRVPVEPVAPEVRVTFTDPRGFTAAEELYRFAPDPGIPVVKTDLSLTENDAALFVKQGKLTYTISKLTGIITEASKDGMPVLTRGPVFCIVPMNGDNGGKPNVAGETYQNNIQPIKNYPLYTLFATGLAARQGADGIFVSMNVTYTDATGTQSYLFTPDGRLVTEYAVRYSGPDSIPYQYGLSVELPKTFDRLSWLRNGEFTTYSPDDISRTEGTARLNARHMPGVEIHGEVPFGAWKDDANDLGSNDFRSTKRFIRTASLSDDSGISVTAVSDGTQHSRSWFQDAHIQWLIANYVNNGSEPFYGSPHTDGRIRTGGKTLSGKTTFTFR